MMAAATYLHTPILAWSVSAEDEERFKRILKQVLGGLPAGCARDAVAAGA